MRLLDTFCGGGGCSKGYADAGFTVTGVDNEPHPSYPYEFILADAVDVLSDIDFLNTFDVVHASPPCQAYSVMAHANMEKQYDVRFTDRGTVQLVETIVTGSSHPELIEEVRELLDAWGGPYIIENVPGAPLIDPVRLCGTAFDLGTVCNDGEFRYLRRHRLFESNHALVGSSCFCNTLPGRAIGVYGRGGGPSNLWRGRQYQAYKNEAPGAMGINWMDHDDITQAIPPAYTEYLGKQMLDLITA